MHTGVLQCKAQKECRSVWDPSPALYLCLPCWQRSQSPWKWLCVFFPQMWWNAALCGSFIDHGRMRRRWCSNCSYNTWCFGSVYNRPRRGDTVISHGTTFSRVINSFFIQSGGASRAVAHHADRNHRSLGEEGGRKNQRGWPYGWGQELSACFYIIIIIIIGESHDSRRFKKNACIFVGGDW